MSVYEGLNGLLLLRTHESLLEIGVVHCLSLDVVLRPC